MLYNVIYVYMLAGCKNVGTMHKAKIKQIEKETLIIVFFLDFEQSESV